MPVLFRTALWLFPVICFAASHLPAYGGHEPLYRFVENKNQWPSPVQFASRIPGGTLMLRPGGFSYYFVDEAELERRHELSHSGIENDASLAENVRAHAVLVNFMQANIHAEAMPFGKSTTYYNYFVGNDPSSWASRAFAYEGVLYRQFYKGIDLKVYAAEHHLKYDFIVEAGADVTQIKVSYEGADELYLEHGSLFVKTSLADIIEKKPIAYQWIDGKKTTVTCAFLLEGNKLSFTFPEGYDSCYPLVIDPLLIFSTYSGSEADNWGSTATPGDHGTLYSSGVTNHFSGNNFSGTFPATAGAFQTSYGGVFDIAILKYDSLGGQMLYASYLGGAASESPHSLVVNAQGELIVLGTTSSLNFPTTASAFDRTFNGGDATFNVVNYVNGSDIILARISQDGTQLLASTFIGGTRNDGLNPSDSELTNNYGDELRGDVITDALGNIYISTVTASTNFPAAASFETQYQGGATDAMLLKIDPNLSAIAWASYLGGNGTDASHTLKLDAAGDIYLAGGTTSTDFPVTAGAYQTALAGEADGWIAKVANDGTAVMHATFTGTTEYDQVYFLDISGNHIFVYGQTAGDFPVTPGVYSNPNSGQFVQKFNNTLTTNIFSTVFGSGRGMPDISPTAFLVNDCNNLFMSGWGGVLNTAHWPLNTTAEILATTPDALQRTTSGSDFYFIVLGEDAGEILYGTYLGGTQSKTHVDGGTSRFDKSGIVYHAVCAGCAGQNSTGQSTSDFPTTPGAWSRTNESINCNNAAFKFDLSSLRAILQTNSVQGDMPGLNLVCIPDLLLIENLSVGGERFEWDLGDGTTFALEEGDPIIHQYQNPGTYTITLTAIDRTTCKAIDIATTKVTIHETDMQFPDDATICQGQSQKLTASGGNAYEWKNESGEVISTQPSVTVSPPDSAVYYIAINDNPCFRRDTVRVNVIPEIGLEFDVLRHGSCEGLPAVTVTNLTDSLRAGDQMFFDFGDGVQSDFEEVRHDYEKPGDYVLKLVGRREFCVYEEIVNVPIHPLVLPNVITPGMPGYNDTFVVQYGDAGVTPAAYGFKTSIIVYNRWGTIVYQNDDYQFDWSGEGLGSGIYFYEVTVEQHATCKSWLHIVR